MTLTATACRLVFNVILWGNILINKNWNITRGSIFSFLAFVIEVKSPDTYMVVSLRNVSWRHTARGLCLTTKILNSSKLGLSPRQFHWMTELVIRGTYGGYFCFDVIHIFVSQISQSLVTIADLETLFSLFQSVWSSVRFYGGLVCPRETSARPAWWIFRIQGHRVSFFVNVFQFS